ncbi:ATP-binding protein [Mucilaginibacter sp. ZT4R22]|uniref:ATP-binding protein n=1 Tax=Mucilaginibacter pankratovii TaxID=2772110 RepID=A0ABR7WKZ2_9SPHI|nr:ATP-binding protein [Mucilaginibacter pankratovii]MBD1362996.1 ATP-binding protein [Mucilaginibacter pankratovii]
MSDTELPDDVGAETIPPKPAALIETFRAIGYNLASAIADIIDNSISADAGNIMVNFQWEEEKSFVTIIDDGRGMTEEEMIEALRPGTSNPLSDRRPSDLGRFGLGLKTASFSQCRRLTVISKAAGGSEPAYRGWDLDYVVSKDVWQIIRYLSKPELAAELGARASGTIIFWEKLDRIIFGQNKQLISKTKFWEAVREVEKHLSMVFHRFIEKKKITLSVNGNPVQPWNPFLIEEPATQSFPEEIYDNGQISIKGFVLPHVSKISPEKFKTAGGTAGWTAQQGFYIYRNDRILVAGDWLDLFRKDDFTRLARIMVEIDSSLDFSWQIDIRKSKAQPPKMFMEKLKRYGAEIRKNAVEVYRYRGKQKQRKMGRSSFEFAWITAEEQGREVFKINRKHPSYRIVRDQLGKNARDFERLISLLEMTLPVQSIVFNENLYADQPAPPPVDDQAVAEMMKAVYNKLISEGFSPQKAKEELYFIDPFSNYPHLTEQLT